MQLKENATAPQEGVKATNTGTLEHKQRSRKCGERDGFGIDQVACSRMGWSNTYWNLAVLED